jgi:hypothetical protein
MRWGTVREESLNDPRTMFRFPPGLVTPGGAEHLDRGFHGIANSFRHGSAGRSPDGAGRGISAARGWGL